MELAKLRKEVKFQILLQFFTFLDFEPLID